MLKTFTMLTLSLLLNAQSLRAASLAPYRYDPGSFKENAYGYPDPNMIKALEFIENLRQNNEDQSVADYDARGAPRPFQEPLFQKSEGRDRVNQDADSAGDASDEDRAEWAKLLLLQALVQAESQTRANGKPYRPEGRYYKQEDEAMDFGGNRQDYNDDDMKDKLSRRHHAAYLEDGYNVNPYKRTNEIVEEQYTPQSLATLESAFRELGTYSPPRKEQTRLEEEHVRKDEEEDDVSPANGFAYEDVADGEDWNSVEMKTRHRHREDEDLEREPEGAGYNVKKPLDEVELNHLDSREKAPREMGGEDERADAAMDLMLQYYKRLQDRMHGGQPGRGAGNAGEERNAESEKVARGTEDEAEPELLDQLVELSSRFQIPPDDILKMLKDVEQKKQAAGTVPEVDSDIPDTPQESSEIGGRRDSKRFRDAYSRGRFSQHNADDDLTTEDILNILGTGDRMYEKPDYFRKADPLKGSRRQPAPYQSYQGHRGYDWARNGEAAEPETGNRATAVDEDELARYLERVVARNPELLNAVGVPRARQDWPLDDQAETDSYQDAVQELLRGLSPREAAEVLSVANNNSPSYTGNAHHAPRRQQKGEDFASMVLKLKEFVNQQNGDRDRAAKESNREMLGIEQY